MIKTTIIGEQAWHVFEDVDGNKIKEECSIQEYDSLAMGGSPSKEGYVWVFSYKDWKYDTVSGRLEDGTYVEVNGKILVKQLDDKQRYYDSLDKVIIKEN